MQRLCDSCQKPYEAKRRTSKFCSPTCRSRASRGAVVADLRPSPTGGLVGAVRRELEEVDRHETALGYATLALAERIAAGNDTGSAVASLTREMRTTLEAAKAGARVADSPLAQMRDELAERRRRRSA